MVRARLPSIAKRLIQFECGADTTVQSVYSQFSSVQFSSVQFRGAIAFTHSAFVRVRPWTVNKPQRVTGRV